MSNGSVDTSRHDGATEQLLTNGSPPAEEINCFIDDNALA